MNGETPPWCVTCKRICGKEDVTYSVCTEESDETHAALRALCRAIHDGALDAAIAKRNRDGWRAK